MPHNKIIPTLNLSPAIDISFDISDDLYTQQKQEEEDNLTASSVINMLNQDAGKLKLKEASDMETDVEDITLKTCLTALFQKDSKKVEARMQMLSASKLLSNGNGGEDHDEEDVVMLENMQCEGASVYLQLVLRGLYLQRQAIKLNQKQLLLRNEGAALVVQG
jgi:hypothetical protein